MDVDDHWHSFSDRSSDVVMATNFPGKSTKVAYTPSFIALAFHNELANRNDNGHVNSGDDPSTSDRNLVGFGPVGLIPEITRGSTVYSRRRSVL